MELWELEQFHIEIDYNFNETIPLKINVITKDGEIHTNPFCFDGMTIADLYRFFKIVMNEEIIEPYRTEVLKYVIQRKKEEKENE